MRTCVHVLRRESVGAGVHIGHKYIGHNEWGDKDRLGGQKAGHNYIPAFWVPAHPYPRNRHAVGDADTEPIYGMP